MTGYGRSKFVLKGKQYTVEIKTLNSKGLDVNLRLHTMFREKEMDLRNLIAGQVVRGKVDCSINNEPGEELRNIELNPELVNAYMSQLKAMAAGLSISDERLFELTVQMPNLTSTAQEVFDPEYWPVVEAALKEALADLLKFRTQEGNNLETDIRLRNDNIRAALQEVEVMDPQRIERTKERLLSGLEQQLNSEQYDTNRFEQELIYYLEKMDITEEITRLRSHCDYLVECMEAAVTEKGKKLGFISQEIGREINTIGSKANLADMQRQVVIMKDELEKIKEQLNNVL
ncbi:MAG: hypothetical protein ABR94_09380 [Sphingobacteriales bacterium BACL12 MAG-120802-bin5]|nr:MAG: hypothetical protein ABR94_09380 [Sphingobacteriales bacterium BACL12 MAG-120802-bin5]